MNVKRKNRWTPRAEAFALHLVLNGATLKQAGEAHGISSERVRQVTNKLIRKLCHPSRLDEPLPERARGSLAEVREHREFWQRRLDAYLAKEGGCNG